MTATGSSTSSATVLFNLFTSISTLTGWLTTGFTWRQVPPAACSFFRGRKSLPMSFLRGGSRHWVAGVFLRYDGIDGFFVGWIHSTQTDVPRHFFDRL